MRWFFESTKVEPWLERYCSELGFSRWLTNLISQKHFKDVDALDTFLNPSLQKVEAPENIEHLDRAVQVINSACKTGKRIAVLSDYDVDGVTSMALMHRGFNALHFNFTPFFPIREKEGYGLTERVVERLLSTGQTFDFLIALDCGTNSVEAVEKLNASGVQVVIVDHHHQTCTELPEAIVVNPHVNADRHSNSAKALCTVGLVFKWLHLWLKYLKREGYAPALQAHMNPFLDLVALGTIADVVPLKDENRIFTSKGLDVLRNTSLPGVQALLHVADCCVEFPLTVDDIGFKLAPRINAGGRLDSADLPYRLLISTDEDSAKIWADQLNDLNIKRQAMERKICQEAEAMILLNPDKMAYVLFNKEWHVGVVGIAAGRLTRKYNRPVFVLGFQDGYAKGSGRSIPEVDLTELFSAADALIKQWGGHPNAVGLTLEEGNLENLENFLNDYLRSKFGEMLPTPVLKISEVLSEEDISANFANELTCLEPFGPENENPIFVIKSFVLKSQPERFGQENSHARFKVNNFNIIAWRCGNTQFPINVPIDLAIQFSWNVWKDKRRLQIQLIDWRYSETPHDTDQILSE